MLRCANKFPRTIIFRRIETLPLKTVHGDMPITWNTAKRTIAARITRPLEYIMTPRRWAILAHNESPEDGWLASQSEATEACWMC